MRLNDSKSESSSKDLVDDPTFNGSIVHLYSCREMGRCKPDENNEYRTNKLDESDSTGELGLGV